MTHANASFSTAALLHALVGQPQAALEVAAGAERSRIPRFNGAMPDSSSRSRQATSGEAAQQVRAQAERAVSGPFIAEADDTLILVAALHHAEGDAERALAVFATTRARGPMGWILAVHLAQQLGILEEHHQRTKRWNERTEQQQIADRARSMDILRTEMASRGWI